MTDIGDVKNGTQAVSLKTAEASAPKGLSSVDRFAGAKAPPLGENGPAPNETTKSTLTLEKGQDPLEQAAKAIQEFVGNTGPETKLRIDKDEDTGRFVYKSIDAESGEVIKQFPPETILQMISNFRDPEGLVLDDNA